MNMNGKKARAATLIMNNVDLRIINVIKYKKEHYIMTKESTLQKRYDF